MASQLMEALQALAHEKKIDEFYLIERLEASLAKSYQNILDLEWDARVTIDRTTGKIYVYELVPVGEPDEETGEYVLLWCTFSLGLLLTLMMLVIWPWGIHAMVVAFVVINVSWLFVWLYFVRRLTGYGYLMFVRDVLPFAIAAVAVMSLTYFATQSIQNLWILLLSRIAIAATAYYAVMRVAHVAILDECIDFIRGKMK